MIVLIAGTAAADTLTPVGKVASPGGVLEVTATLNGEGRPGYAVTRKGKPVVEESRLGFLLTNGLRLERNFDGAAAPVRSADETWEQPWGERRFVRNHFNELRVTFTERGALARRFDVVFRVYDYGLGFRYEFPEQPNLKNVHILEELTEFAVVDSATAWWIPGGEWNRYEYLYRKTPLREAPQVHTPITLRTEQGLHIAIHEAALVDYAGMWLRRVEGQRLKAVLSPASQGAKVKRTAPFTTPWRTLQIADSAGDLYESSDLILNLNEANKLGDVSWFEPSKYIGIWWEMHLGTGTWGSGPKHSANTRNAKRYVDFAAKHGFRGVLIEGWNQGWDGDWFSNGAVFSFTKAYPDFDLEGVAAYAKRKGVHLVGHHETSGHIANYERQLADALDLYARHGIDSVKTGYVADAGGIQALGEDGKIHFEWHDGQVQSRHHLKVVTQAAKRRIAVLPHEPIKDTGLRRTYPNWISREGARGMEYNAWGSPPNPPEHEANLVFTRMLSGPFDFTPGVLSLQGAGQRIQSTIAKQLATYVVLYAPVQMAADLPENYEKYPREFQFIKDVPTDWSDTRVLNGEVGDYVTFARKDRGSDDWYIGSVTDEEARTLEMSLDFLDANRRYEAQIYRDGEGADWKTNPHAIAIEKRQVGRADKLSLWLAPGGGAAIRLRAR
jgi:alpha-glucosidase